MNIKQRTVKLSFLVIILLFSMQVQSQSMYKKGYITTLNKEKIEGFWFLAFDWTPEKGKL